MDWNVFSYSLPTKQGSSSRVALWRRLQRLGAISVAGGAYVLPAREECSEAFQWLAQEIRSAGGEALVMRVERFEGLTDKEIVSLFCKARAGEYREMGDRISDLTGSHSAAIPEDMAHLRGAIARLRRRYSEIAHIDYFNCPEGKLIAHGLSTLEQLCSPILPSPVSVPKADIDQYRRKVWVTRPHPYIDRLACIWLIRHFINAQATIRYSERPKLEEASFDMEGGEFGHRGNLCTFETMLLAFGFNDPGLHPLAEIVHEIDLRDGRYAWPETTGIEKILSGWAAAGLSDKELESRGVALFEGLYTALARESGAGTQPKNSRSG